MAFDVTQIRVGAMAVFCYAVTDRETRATALIDPAFETAKILSIVQRSGLRATHVINTHGHSDHTAGNAAIIRATGAALCIHEKDAPKLGKLLNSAFSRVLGGAGSPRADVILKDNDTLKIGNGTLRVIHTPGHTPGGICLYTPGHVFTGDTLFVGAVGRTDLPGGSSRGLVESIRKRLYSLPENTIVWPGHDYGPHPQSTIGQENATNPFTR